MTTEMPFGMGGQLPRQLVWYVFCDMAEETNFTGGGEGSYSTFYLGSEKWQGKCLA
jgi:hypothetical protein